MKTCYLLMLLAGVLFGACSSDDDTLPREPDSDPELRTSYRYAFENRSGRTVEIAKVEYDAPDNDNNLPNMIGLEDGELYCWDRPYAAPIGEWNPFGGEEFWLLFDDARVRMDRLPEERQIANRAAYTEREVDGTVYQTYVITEADYQSARRWDINPIWPDITTWDFRIENRSGHALEMQVNVSLMEDYYKLPLEDGQIYTWNSQNWLQEPLLIYGGYISYEDGVLIHLNQLKRTPANIFDYERGRVDQGETHWYGTFVFTEEDYADYKERKVTPSGDAYYQYYLVNESGVDIAVEIVSAVPIPPFPDHVEIKAGEYYTWNHWHATDKDNQAAHFNPFTISEGSRIIYDNKVEIATGRMSERYLGSYSNWEFSRIEEIEPDMGYTWWRAIYTFTEEDYQYALEHGTEISEDQMSEVLPLP